MTILEFVIWEKFGGGPTDWELADEICNHIYEKFGYDLETTDLQDVNDFSSLLAMMFDIIVRQWETYISAQEGKDVDLNLEYFINFLDSHIDFGADGYGLHWSDTSEEAYHKYKAVVEANNAT